MEYVKLVDVWKTYRTKAGSVTPLRGVNLSVDKGELVVVLGPSGEGKDNASEGHSRAAEAGQGPRVPKGGAG